MIKVDEFDTVLLKDGTIASLVDKLSDTYFVATIGNSPETWKTIDVSIDMIEKVLSPDTV